MTWRGARFTASSKRAIVAAGMSSSVEANFPGATPRLRASPHIIGPWLSDSRHRRRIGSSVPLSDEISAKKQISMPLGAAGASGDRLRIRRADVEKGGRNSSAPPGVHARRPFARDRPRRGIREDGIAFASQLSSAAFPPGAGPREHVGRRSEPLAGGAVANSNALPIYTTDTRL
jgi:hypothetical protein